MFWNQEYAPSLGGVEIYTRNLASGLLSRGHEVCVVTSHSRADLPLHEQMEGIAVYRFPFYQALASRDLDQIAHVQKQISELKRTFAPDLVHVNFTDASPFFHIRTQRRNERAVAVFHGPVDGIPAGIQFGTMLAVKSGALVVPSPFMKEHLAVCGVAPPERVRVIYNSAREDLFTQIEQGSSGSDPVLLFAARLVPEKGGEVLLRAVKTLADRGKKVRVRIAGAGPEKENLRGMATALNIADTVHFEGALSQAQLAQVMTRVHAVVVPSVIQESAGMIALEAALAGKPVIASSAGGLSDMVEDEKTGLLFEAGNHAALADTIERLLGDPSLQKRLGEAARARALKHFTLDAMVENYERLYLELMPAALR